MTSTWNKGKKLSPFDFVKSINEKGDDLIKLDPTVEKEYTPFVINRALSFSPDAILHANVMNMNHHVDKKLQYDYLFHAVRKRKRYDKWIKKDENDRLVEIVSEVYEVNQTRALEYIALMSPADRERISKGYGGS